MFTKQFFLGIFPDIILVKKSFSPRVRYTFLSCYINVLIYKLREDYSLYRSSFRSFPKHVPLKHGRYFLPILRIPPL
jgi:hypothetical protein